MKRLFRRKVHIELLLIFVSAIFFFQLSKRIDLLELIYDFSRAHEDWELDEFFALGLFLALVFFVFAFRRIIDLGKRNKELNQALEEIKELKGIIPICSSCKKIRDDGGYWHEVEVYVKNHTEAEFSHGLCPECAKKIYPKSFKDKEET